ncbi:MAG TPA: GNAT family N-acetyltransferase [Candidatus Nitrosotalea sp.]|nr:GNAT family N-acetyltransferase [Nitrososphaerota archaeon]HKU33501.1 GNAT family N-acetyltransferase [Candidatus Nitrosotalea sp.]
MTEIKIRKLQKKDIANGFLHSLDSLRKASDLSPKKAQAVFDKISSDPNEVIYVAVIDSKVVGAASIIIEQKFIHGGGKAGHIEDVVVAKEFQGRGIGQKVVRALLEYAQKRGCYKTILDCSDDLIPFYEKLGFKKYSNAMRFDHRSKT